MNGSKAVSAYSILTPSRLSFWVISSIIILQMTLGEWFYKSHIGPIYLTELFILIAWFIAIPEMIMKLRIPRASLLYPLLLLSLAYLVYSFLKGREAFWVFRQGAFLLYLSVAILSYKHVHRNYNVLHWDHIFRMSGIVGGLLYLFHGYTALVPLHPWSPTALVFFVGYSYWLVKAKSVLKKIIIGASCSLLIALFSNTSISVAPIFILWASLFIGHRRLRLLLVLSGLAAGVLAFAFLPGLTDGSAAWRYLMWLAVIMESWDRGFFLLGKGFGIQYIPSGFKSTEKLIWQATMGGEQGFQLMSVHAHNGILNILIYLGIIGVLIFCYPLYKGGKMAVKRRLGYPGQVLLLCTCGYFVILCANQFLEAPYAGVTFWMIYGALMACFKVKPSKLESSKH